MDVVGGDSRTRWIKSADKSVMSFGHDTSQYTSPLPHCTRKHFQQKTLPSCSLSLDRLRSPQYNLSLSKCAADWSGEVLSLTHRPPLHQGMFLVLIFIRGWVDSRTIVRSEGSMSLKNPVTPSSVVPATVRTVAQCLNHYATPGHWILDIYNDQIYLLFSPEGEEWRLKNNW
jgi:hypothetical protein